MTTPQVAVNFDRSKSSNQVTTNDVVNSGSSLTAAGDIRLRATGNGAKDGAGKATDGDITVTGSTIMAGGTAMLDAERNITLQASTDHYQESSQATSSSTHFSTAIPSLGDLGRAIGGGPNNSGVGGFPYGKANSSGIGDSTASTQTATLVSGNNVVLNSRSGDIRIAGSGADAVQDINVIAKRGQIDISSGQDSRRRQEEQSSHAVGDLGSNAKDGSMGTGFTVGEKREHSTLDTAQTQQSTIRSQLSAGGNITLDAKEDITATGIDLRAGRDLTAIGKNVYLDPGQDTVHTLQSSEMSQVGVTVSTSGYAVEAAKALEQAAKATEQKDDKRLAALYGAKAALTVYNGMGAPSGSSAANPQSQAIVKVTASIGSSSAESKSENAATQNMGSTLTAGGTVTVIATGSGEKDAAGKAVNGDISARGTLISGTNVELIAARDINLQSAKDTTQDRSSDGSRNASVGVGFALGGQQNGFTLELAAAKAEGNANGDSITHQNTIVTASDTLIVNSGRDTNLNGAQVRGETVIANIGRDLNIASQQDADTYHSKQDSAGFSASVCIPPFCYGTTVEASANAAKANTDSTYQSVKEQSGLYAGKGGFDVTVKGNTDLKGGVLASDAEASRNRLVTGTLTTSDIENKA
jgi:filamentous hemagglutinin